MIVYADSSVLARAYLKDEPGHAAAHELLTDPERPVVTGSWSKLEVSGAIVRAARTPGRLKAADEAVLLAEWDADTAGDSVVSVLAMPQNVVEAEATDLVRDHGLRAMDAWHLAAALIIRLQLPDPGEPVGFASRHGQQATVAESLGLTLV